MARTTVDDCLEQCPNHFDLTYRASRRARDLMKRGDPRVPEYGDKPVVVALRELADPKTLEEPAPPEAEAPEAVVFDADAGRPFASPDEPDPTAPTAPPDSPDPTAPADPTGEREAAGVARTPDEPQPPDNID